MARSHFQSVDEYIGTFPKDVQDTLQTVRRTIQKAVPEAEEIISYQIPAYKYHGRLVYFAAFKDHYSIFGAIEGVRLALKKDLAPYVQAKGTIRFPYGEPIPTKLIREITVRQAKENLRRAKEKKKAR